VSPASCLQGRPHVSPWPYGDRVCPGRSHVPTGTWVGTVPSRVPSGGLEGPREGTGAEYRSKLCNRNRHGSDAGNGRDGRGSPVTTRAEYDGAVALLARIFRDTVDLAGALCTGQSDLFDEDPTPEVYGQALEVCRRCPVRAACWQWSRSTRVAGTTASTVQRPRSWTDTSLEADSTGGRRIGTSPTAVRSRRHRATQRVNERHNDDGSIDQ
jgi:hypothetical protein